MKFNSSKLATMPRTLAGHLVLAELQAEARRERFAASFDQHFADDDATALGNPSPMDSAQSRRAQGVAL